MGKRVKVRIDWCTGGRSVGVMAEDSFVHLLASMSGKVSSGHMASYHVEVGSRRIAFDFWDVRELKEVGRVD